MISKKNIKKLKGDASHRIFYRKINKDSSSILVFAKKGDYKKNRFGENPLEKES